MNACLCSKYIPRADLDNYHCLCWTLTNGFFPIPAPPFNSILMHYVIFSKDPQTKRLNETGCFLYIQQLFSNTRTWWIVWIPMKRIHISHIKISATLLQPFLYISHYSFNIYFRIRNAYATILQNLYWQSLKRKLLLPKNFSLNSNIKREIYW